jgi:hypothetical protein
MKKPAERRLFLGDMTPDGTQEALVAGFDTHLPAFYVLVITS